MKNYLLKITYLGTLCLGLMMFACSDDDGDNSSNGSEQIDDDGDNSSDDSGQIDNDGDDQSDNNDGSTGNGSVITALTDTCSECPELIIDQTNSSGSTTFTYPAGIVCKGEDGKAYYENGDPVDELGLTYEQHINVTLGSYGRVCK